MQSACYCLKLEIVIVIKELLVLIYTKYMLISFQVYIRPDRQNEIMKEITCSSRFSL